ncbi:MAG TPA: acyl-CoA dehydrogenase family protein [Bacillales bacterium]|nr:acyl-CoA dehydrogenase family protein [Bacillales bacterium]
MEGIVTESNLSTLKRTVRSLVKDHVYPVDRNGVQFSDEITKELQQKGKQSGLWLMGTKKELGGAGLSFYDRSVLFEEQVQHRFGLSKPAGLAFGNDLPSFLEKCTSEQVDKFIKPAVQSGNGCFVGVWEEIENNNIGQLVTTATKEGDYWVINGEKSYVANVDKANFGVVLAHCIHENEVKPTLFIINKDESIIVKDTMLIDVQKVSQLTFNSYKLHDSQRIGDVGEGVSLINQWLTESQLEIAAKCIGIGKKALNLGIDYAKLRITRGKPLAEFPTIRTMIARSATELESARQLVGSAAKKLDEHDRNAFTLVAMAKLHATEVASKIIDNIFQIHGGMGFSGDAPLERWYKELRILRLNYIGSETLIEQIALHYFE